MRETQGSYKGPGDGERNGDVSWIWRKKGVGATKEEGVVNWMYFFDHRLL